VILQFVELTSVAVIVVDPNVGAVNDVIVPLVAVKLAVVNDVLFWIVVKFAVVDEIVGALSDVIVNDGTVLVFVKYDPVGSVIRTWLPAFVSKVTSSNSLRLIPTEGSWRRRTSPSSLIDGAEITIGRSDLILKSVCVLDSGDKPKF
jgi:hypothetical protein